MTAVLVWKMADGSVRIDAPALTIDPGENVTDYLNRVAAKLLATQPTLTGAVRLADSDDSTLPSRRFRAAWRENNGAVQVHFATARAALIAELRKQRDGILTQSDALKAKYDDIGTAPQKTAVFNYRQSLRDVTTQIQTDLQAMTTVAQLDAYVAPIPPLPNGITL